MIKNLINVVALVALFASSAQAKINTVLVDYVLDGAKLQGAIVYDDALTGPRPGVIVFHEWRGRGPYVQMRAEKLASLGYVAFAADLYGKGLYAKDHAEAAKLLGLYNDRHLVRKRAVAAFEIIKKDPRVDKKRIAAIGYCFGGMAALELARSGAELNGVVLFHGNLDTKDPEATKAVKAKVLAFIGVDDSFITPAIPAFESEMNKAKVDFQLVLYSGTVHSFTVTDAGNDLSTGTAYNATSDRRSWQAMRDFFNEIFA